jgi:hypothetical protein
MATVLESARVEPSAVAKIAEGRDQETWAASRARMQKEEKEMMARHFAEHDFLLPEGANPAAGPRETAACILVNQGTGPNVVVHKSLHWISDHAGEGPFHITWYSPGGLVPATLYDFRQGNPNLSAAAHAHLFPGTVDIQLQAQVGAEAQEYARRLTRRFSYMILSAHSFDLHTGEVLFHFEREIPIQNTCALLRATQKFLFLDSQKFTGEGEIGYSLRDLLATSNAVIIYTVSSSRSEEIKAAFNALAATLLATDPPEAGTAERKTMRLTIVGRQNTPSEALSHQGFLTEHPAGDARLGGAR